MSEKTIAEKLTDIANDIPIIRQKAYAEGYNNGLSASDNEYYEAGVEAGKQAEWDAFWDAYQDYGNRRSYSYAFTRSGWNNETFKPKYPLIADGDASYMFDYAEIGEKTDNGGTFDFVENGIEMDLSGATSLTYIFRNCGGIKRFGTIDCSGCTNLNRLFYSCKVVTIDKFIVNENITYSNTFDYANKLENITVEGVIGQNGFNVSVCPLTRDSLMSIINHLKDFSGTSTTKTLTLGTTNLAKLTDSEKAIATEKGWSLA